VTGTGTLEEGSDQSGQRSTWQVIQLLKKIWRREVRLDVDGLCPISSRGSIWKDWFNSGPLGMNTQALEYFTTMPAIHEASDL
jgi:hypothetical protein